MKAKNGLHGADIYANSCTIKAEFGKVGVGMWSDGNYLTLHVSVVVVL